LRLKAQALRGLGRHSDAFELLLKLAPQGNPAVLYMLGDYYSTGQGGVKRDLGEAKRLFMVAARSGDQRAVERLKKLDDVASGAPPREK
jgi:TPR repeat protein